MQFQLCSLESISEGCARALNIKGMADVFAVKKQGRLYLYRNKCPHSHVPLNWEPDRFLDNSGDLIQCSTHGALFAIEDGLCLQGPCPGERLEAIPFELRNGIIYVDR